MWKNYRISELTAETTDYDLDAPVNDALSKLYVAVGERQQSSNLQYHLNEVAEAEGQRDIARRFVYLLRDVEGGRKGLSRVRAVMSIADDMAGKTADDSWSGRKNEIARVFHDGQREMFGELFSYVIAFNDEFLATLP